jgi:CheY-like chemotaxis protein
MNILLIEDSDLQATVFGFELQRRGHTLSRARNGEEGLQKMRELSPDVILLDIIMDGMDGFSVLQERQKDASLQKAPVIMLTDLREQSDIDNAKNLGASDYFVKNKMQIDVLLEKMQESIDKWKEEHGQ